MLTSPLPSPSPSPSPARLPPSSSLVTLSSPSSAGDASGSLNGSDDDRSAAADTEVGMAEAGADDDLRASHGCSRA